MSTLHPDRLLLPQPEPDLQAQLAVIHRDILSLYGEYAPGTVGQQILLRVEQAMRATLDLTAQRVATGHCVIAGGCCLNARTPLPTGKPLSILAHRVIDLVTVAAGHMDIMKMASKTIPVDRTTELACARQAASDTINTAKLLHRVSGEYESAA